jgi:hypothetical protein
VWLWLDEAALDRLLHDPTVTDVVLGFHCYQAAERMLKAVLLAAGGALPATYDLDGLIRMLDEHGVSLPQDLEQMTACAPYERVVDDPRQAPPPGSFDRDAGSAMLHKLHAWAELELRRRAPLPLAQAA